MRKIDNRMPETPGASTAKTETADIMMLILYKGFQATECKPMDCKIYHSLLRQFTETIKRWGEVDIHGQF